MKSDDINKTGVDDS
jgi:hypothetical protein